MDMRRTPLYTRTSRKSLKILHVYFWLHGLGLSSKFGPRCVRRRSSKFVSVLLAVFIDGNMIYVTYLVLRNYKVSGNGNLIRIFVLLCFNTLTLIQRYFLYSRNAYLDKQLSRVLWVCSQIPVIRSPPDFCRILLVFLFLGDVYLILMMILFFETLTYNPLYDLISKTTPSSTWVYVAYFCIFWKNTGHCIALYFTIVCLSLKRTFSGMGDVRISWPYNTLVDVTKSFNEILHPLILAMLMECLGHVFYQSFNLFYIHSDSLSLLVYKVLYATFHYLRFLVVCVSASSATNAAYDAKYRIRGFLAIKNVQELNEHCPAFTVLDSIVVDKSLVLTASGILLTYGVMVATLSESSKNP